MRRVRPIPEEIKEKKGTHLRPESQEIKKKETRVQPTQTKPKSLAKKELSPTTITDFSTCIPKLEEEEKPIEYLDVNYRESTESLLDPDCYCYSKGYSAEERENNTDSVLKYSRSSKECGCPKDKVCLPTTCRQNDDLERTEDSPTGIDQGYLNIEYDEMKDKHKSFYPEDMPPGFRHYKFVPRGTLSSPNFVISGLPRPVKHFTEEPEPYKWTKDQLRKPASPPPSPPLTRPPSRTPSPKFTVIEPFYKPVPMKRPIERKPRTPSRHSPSEF